MDKSGASWFDLGEHVRAGVGPAVLSAGLAPECEACVAGEAGSVCPPGTFLAVGSELVPLTVGDRVVDGAEDVVGEHRKIGRAHVCTPGTNANLVCGSLMEKKKSGQANKSYKT